MADFMAAPCVHCPFKRDVRPFLHPERAYDIGLEAESKFGTFPCHKTTVETEDEDGFGEREIGENTKECAGSLCLRATSNGSTFYDEDGFEPKAEWNCYEDAFEMHQAYLEQWLADRRADPDDKE
jgi:hypothetical protein